jgi:glycosyltransferase involved in cell wall biosynthesis
LNILFVHCNYPAQFRHLSQRLLDAGTHRIVFLSQNKEWTAETIDGLQMARYQLGRDPQGQLCHPYLRRFETAVLHGQAAFRKALELKQQGFEPDLIIGHSGFGNTLYLKEVWPRARFLGYFEWFYRSSGSDVGFGRAEPPSPDTAMRVHTYNTPIVMDLALCDAALCPTQWQASQFPKPLRDQLDVVFDGINTDLFKPLDNRVGLSIGELRLPPEVPLVTYVTRGFEPYRGWPQVAQGLSLLLQRNPRAHVLLVGSDDVAYGSKRGDGKSWRQWALEEYPMDPSRVHMLPALQYEQYRQVLQHSWVHVYWTIPFILSWSLMESLATGCCVVASQTPPVQEMIRSGQQGILVDFFDPDALAQQLDALLQDRIQREQLGQQARQHILDGGFDLSSCVQRQLQLVEQVMA